VGGGGRRAAGAGDGRRAAGGGLLSTPLGVSPDLAIGVGRRYDRFVSDQPDPIRIGISACLLGQEVRYDGGHKRDPFLVETLGPHVVWVPSCPEVEVGMGTPREPVQLVRDRAGRPDNRGPVPMRLVAPKSGTDWTDRMTAYSKARVAKLARLDLSGYVLKKDSPSCGMARVKVHGPGRTVERTGTGLFAAALREALPTLPVEEEGRLCDPRLRENFIERVFAYRRLRTLLQGRWSVGDLVRFHTAHKLVLLAHDPRAYASLGRLVARARERPRATVAESYEREFMGALARPATPRQHANVLQHIAGYLRDGLDAASKAELQALIDDHRKGLVPLVVPITLVRHHVRRLGIAYLQGQVYLEPHPKELALRNHV
jgi:uncharacterized protein YbgA (DUF1722 family)/uncharacterized protein YbbK (DUF523 family)